MNLITFSSSSELDLEIYKTNALILVKSLDENKYSESFHLKDSDTIFTVFLVDKNLFFISPDLNLFECTNVPKSSQDF